MSCGCIEWGGSLRILPGKEFIRFRRSGCRSRSSRRSRRREACLTLDLLHIFTMSNGQCPSSLELMALCKFLKCCSILWSVSNMGWCLHGMVPSLNHYTFICKVLVFFLFPSQGGSSISSHLCITQEHAGDSDVQLMVGWSFVKTVSNLAQFCFLPDHYVILCDSTHYSTTHLVTKH